MPGMKDVLAKVAEGYGMFHIMQHLHLSPSKLVRILRSPQMRKYMQLQKEIAGELLALNLAVIVTDTPRTLFDTARGNQESGRRASLDLLREYRKGAEAAKQGKRVRTGQNRAKAGANPADLGKTPSVRAESGQTRPVTADLGRTGQARKSQKIMLPVVATKAIETSTLNEDEHNRLAG